MPLQTYIPLLLRIGLAFAFLYPAVSAFVTPTSWIGYFPPFLLDLFAENELVLLHAFGISEIFIALWLLSGKKIFTPSVLAAAYLFGVVAFNIPSIDVVFRDLSLALTAVALALWHYPKNQKRVGS